MTTQIDWQSIEQQVEALAVQIFGGYGQLALKDFRSFRNETENDLMQWIIAAVAGEITKEELAELVKGQQDLLKLHSLKQLGLAEVALDKFVQGVTSILISSLTSLI